MTTNPIVIRLTWVLLIGMIIIAVVVPLIAPPPDAIDPNLPLHGPTWIHWLGTDELGRDLLARLALGAQISLLIGLLTACVATLLGTTYGLIAGYRQGWTDTVMMRFLDILYSLPGLMIVILLGILLGRSLLSLVLALALFNWPDTARMIRGQVMSLSNEEFVEAYHNLGGSTLRLFITHFVPNLWGLIILTVTLTVPRAILTEATLSFVGLGVTPPLSSWGTMIADGWTMIRLGPHLLIMPAFMLMLTVMSINILGDNLEKRLSRRQTG